MSSTDFLYLLEQYRYVLIFPTAIIEGPIITVISGFLAHLGYLSFLISYITLIMADLVGCSLYYLVGRYWRTWIWIKKYTKLWGYDEKSEQFLENHFKKHKVKTIFIAKLSHGIGWMAHLSAGIAKVNFFEFALYNFLSALPKTLALMAIGYYAGNYYQKIDGYLGFFSLTLGFLAVLVVLYIVANKYVRKFWKKEEVSGSVDI